MIFNFENLDFLVPKKRVHVVGLAVNHGCLEDPVLGSFLNIFGEFFFKKVTSVV